MIRPIMTNEFFLSQSSDRASVSDTNTCSDLMDTIEFHKAECVGMAANMIGIPPRIIVFNDAGRNRLMLNPEIIEAQGEYETEEGCLSLVGTRKTRRYQRITVVYLDEGFIEREERFTGFTAQIIQHEIDHCDGILI